MLGGFQDFSRLVGTTLSPTATRLGYIGGFSKFLDSTFTTDSDHKIYIT